MNSLAEAKIKEYLVDRLHYDPYDCGTIVECMLNLARLTGHGLDDRFRHAGLGAGPEARIAACLVDRALLGGGCETTEYALRQHIDDWLMHNPPKGL